MSWGDYNYWGHKRKMTKFKCKYCGKLSDTYREHLNHVESEHKDLVK